MLNTDEFHVLDNVTLNRQIIEASPLGMILVDARLPDRPIVYVNAAFERHTGYSLDEVVGKNCRFLQAGDHNQPALEILRAALRDQAPCTVTLRNYRKDGTLFWNELRISPIYGTDGSVTHFMGIQSDVTTTKQAEQHLIDSEYRYRMLFEESKEAIFLIDLDGIYLRANHRASEMFGYTPEEMIGKNSFDLIAPEEHSKSHNMLARLLNDEKPPLYERWFVRKDGSRVLALVNAALIRDHHGKPLHIQSILHDITERRAIELALQDSFEELERFFTLSMDLLCVADTDGNFIKLNKVWEATLDYPLSELQGRRFLDFVHPDDQEATRQAIAKLDAQYPLPHFINRYRRRDGTYCYLEWQSYPHGKLIYAAARDITERIQMEMALRDSEARYRSVVNTMSEGIVLRDGAGVVQTCNTAAERILGVTAQQIIGQIWIDPGWNPIHEDGSPYPIETHPALTTLHTGQPVSNAIMGIHKPDGQIIWLLINARPILHPDERQPSAVVTSFSDITELKKAEEHAVALALEKERLGLLTQFIQNAAHEFRTPLSAINSGAYMLSRAETPEQRQQYTRRIEEQVMRTTKLVDMLLEMVRLESQAAPLQQDIPVHYLLASVAEAFKPAPDRPPVQIDASPDLPHLTGDRERLQNALRHILDNALRFTPADGRVIMRARADGQNIVIEIQDTGIGIHQVDMPHIFKLFWRKDVAHTSPGMGLGLSIAQKIIHMHGGDILVQSESGQGSVVRVILPFELPPLNT